MLLSLSEEAHTVLLATSFLPVGVHTLVLQYVDNSDTTASGINVHSSFENISFEFSLRTLCPLMCEQWCLNLNVNVFLHVRKNDTLSIPLFCTELIFIRDIRLFVCLVFFASPKLDSVRVTNTGTMALC